ncbi:MAG: hypothetical protein E6713_10360 [Sporomusaceae bacterium]|nr:hypothetical protein [Sporomusaceae bacterium]
MDIKDILEDLGTKREGGEDSHSFNSEEVEKGLAELIKQLLGLVSSGNAEKARELIEAIALINRNLGRLESGFSQEMLIMIRPEKIDEPEEFLHGLRELANRHLGQFAIGSNIAIDGKPFLKPEGNPAKLN